MKKIIIPIMVIILLVGAWAVFGRKEASTPATEPHTAQTLPEAPDTAPVSSEPSQEAEEAEPAPAPKAVMVNHNVPFTSQAPTGEWEDQRQQDGCEEASAYMAILWVKGEKVPSPAAVRDIIVKISDFEQDTYGEYRDVSLEDIRDWIFKDYFKYSNVEVKQGIEASDIIAALQAGHVIIAPMNGQRLGNPYFSGDGPERHMLVIRGYDPAKKQFITNDPGTRRGENFRYSEATIMDAIVAYPTGYHEPADPDKKGILIVKK